MEKKTSPAKEQSQSKMQINYTTGLTKGVEAEIRQHHISTVNICFFDDGCKLVKQKNSEGDLFSLKALIGNQWETVNQWDDPGHVANLLVKFGYESEHLPAIKLLTVL